MSKFSQKWKNPGSKYKDYYNPLYQSWKNIFRRIENKNGKYPTYFDVTVCEEWYDYDVFFEWATTNGWKPGLVLDKDSIKPGNRVYCPEYCKWISKAENAKERIQRAGHNMKDPNVSKKLIGKNNNSSKAVICVETGKIYDCGADAERELKLTKHSVCRTANPKTSQKTTGGYHFVFKEDKNG